jgi:hypothetical protein
VRLLALVFQAVSVENVSLNALQYALPILVSLICLAMLGGHAPRRRRSAGPDWAGGASARAGA